MEESTSNTSLKEENIIIHTSFLSLFILLDIIFINSPILLIKFNVCVANGVTWLIRGRASKCIIYVSRSSIVLNLKNTIKMDLHLQIVQNKLVIYLNWCYLSLLSFVRISPPIPSASLATYADARWATTATTEASSREAGVTMKHTHFQKWNLDLIVLQHSANPQRGHAHMMSALGGGRGSPKSRQQYW